MGLTLSNTRLGDVGIQHLAQALAQARSITELDLSWNQVTASGAEKLSTCLRSAKGCQLVELNLDCNDLRETGAAAIASAIRRQGGNPDVDNLQGVCHTLQTLKLAGNSIGLRGARSLAAALTQGEPLLCELDLSRNRLGPEGAGLLTEALISANASLRKLGLAVNRLADAGMRVLSEAVAKIPKTSARAGVALNLRGNHIGDAGAAALAAALAQGAPLEFVDLSYNSITAPGVSALSQGIRDQCNSGDSGASVLLSLTIEGNPAGAGGQESIASALKQRPKGDKAMET